MLCTYRSARVTFDSRKAIRFVNVRACPAAKSPRFSLTPAEIEELFSIGAGPGNVGVPRDFWRRPGAFFRDMLLVKCACLCSHLCLGPSTPLARHPVPYQRLVPAFLPCRPWLGVATGLPVHKIQIIAEYHRPSVTTA